jgi:hypothetical protein
MKTGSSLPVSFISLRFERVDNLGGYRIPPETGILIPSDFIIYRYSHLPRDAKENHPGVGRLVCEFGSDKKHCAFR